MKKSFNLTFNKYLQGKSIKILLKF